MRLLISFINFPIAKLMSPTLEMHSIIKGQDKKGHCLETGIPRLLHIQIKKGYGLETGNIRISLLYIYTRETAAFGGISLAIRESAAFGVLAY